MVLRQFVEDLSGDLLLPVREGEGQSVVEGREKAVRGGFARYRRELGVRVAAAGQGHLEDEGLVPPEAGLGGGGRGPGGGGGASARSALVCGRWILRSASGRGTRPRPSRRDSGRGSTASWALGSTVW